VACVNSSLFESRNEYIFLITVILYLDILQNFVKKYFILSILLLLKLINIFAALKGRNLYIGSV